jgi:uncharacterized membrane protein YphA (DoxX/SURF4 family)
MSATVAHPGVIDPATDSVDETRLDPRTLIVPMGGTGWGWRLFSRWAIFWSLHEVLSIIPGGWAWWYYSLIGRIDSIFKKYLPLFPQYDGSGSYNEPRFIILAILVPVVPALIWLLLDRSRKYEVHIQEAARLMCRFSLLHIFSSYGWEKIVGGQGLWAFEPKYVVSPYGDQWGNTTMMTWLGYSTIYEHFAAWVEIGSGLLLAFRRTTTLGAILYMAALINVWIVNTGYGEIGLMTTPFHFMPFAIFLLAPELKRLGRFFFGLPADPQQAGLITPPMWWHRSGLVLKAIVIPWIMWKYIEGHFNLAQDYVRKSPIGGLYTVEYFERNGVEERLAYEYPKRWRNVAVGRVGEDITAIRVDDVREHILLGAGFWRGEPAYKQVVATRPPEGDIPVTGHMVIPWGEATKWEKRAAGKLHYVRSVSGELTFSGRVDEDSLVVRLKRVPLDTLPFFRHRFYLNEWRHIFWTGDK